MGTTDSNAIVTKACVWANSPAVTLSHSVYKASISPMNIVENTVGTISTGGYVCVVLDSNANTAKTGATTSHTNLFNTASTPG